MLNSHRSFFLSYAAPVLWNIAQIAALVVAAAMALSVANGAVLLAWAVVIGGVLQVAIQLPRVRGYVPSLRPTLRRDGLVDDVIRRFLPAVGARGVVQVSSFIDTFFLTLLVGGAASFYLYALPLYVTPISLFGFSVAAAELAEMSRRSGQINVLAARITPALRRTVVPAGFITAAYLAAGPTWADGLYGWISRILDRGLTDPAGILVIGYLLMAMALGLPAAITARVTQNTLYSLGDVKGPARIAVVRVVVSVVTSYLLMLQLDWLTFNGTSIVEFGSFPHWPPWERVPELQRELAGTPHLGVVGIGLGSSLAAWVEWTLLRLRLRSRLGRAGTGAVSSDWGLNVFIAGVGAGSAIFLATLVPLPSPIDAALALLIGLGVYGSLLWVQDIRPGSIPGALGRHPSP